MTLRIEKHSDGHKTTIRLTGRMPADHLKELEKQIRESGPAITLDLEEVTLVDVETVRFLGLVKHGAPRFSVARPTYATGSAKSKIKE